MIILQNLKAEKEQKRCSKFKHFRGDFKLFWLWFSQLFSLFSIFRRRLNYDVPEVYFGKTVKILFIKKSIKFLQKKSFNFFLWFHDLELPASSYHTITFFSSIFWETKKFFSQFFNLRKFSSQSCMSRKWKAKRYGVNFINILRAPFPPIILRQKNTKPKCN
jgi:hypothetical protein